MRIKGLGTGVRDRHAGSLVTEKGGSMKTRILLFLLTVFAVPGLVVFLGLGGMGCGGSSSGSGDSATETPLTEAASFALPSEISAVPTEASAQASISKRSFSAAIKSLAKAATDSGTDYSNAVTDKYIEERTLEQFEILESVMSAMDQTHYTDQIGNGPYTAKVSWEEEQGKGSVKVDTKTIETWVCRADWIKEDGNVADNQASATGGLRLRAWIKTDIDGGTGIVRAQVVITDPPTRNDDGSYANYGAWEMNVKFGDGDNDYFTASSALVDKDGDGIKEDNVIEVRDKFVENFPGGGEITVADKTVETIGVMHRSGPAGYGRVSYPDFGAMYDPALAETLMSIPTLEVTYAYNETHLAVQRSDEGTPTFKSRDSQVPMTHRYGVFNSETGVYLMNSRSFGFPVRYEAPDENGQTLTRHAYYGAWQGRHQLWIDEAGGTVAEGTTVTRDDMPPEEAEQYVIGDTFYGTLAKRSYVDATLDDIKNIPVETWVDENYQLVYNNGAWYECYEINWSLDPIQCVEGQLASTAFDFSTLLVGENDTRKNVGINGPDQMAMENKQFVYIESDPQKPDGLYEAELVNSNFGMRFEATNTPIDTDNVQMLWVNIGGSIYVEYKGEADGWVEKVLDSFNTMDWKPTFNNNGDKPYIFPDDGRQLYINMEGANYVVWKDGEDADYTVQLELQTVANPTNAATFVPAGTVFRNEWDVEESGSTYEFVTDSTSGNFLQLVYKTIGDDDKDPEGNPNEGVAIGGVVTESIWGLRANIDTDSDGDLDPVDFNWEYSDIGGWGAVTYLKNTDDSYKILDDPVHFNSITLNNGAGEARTLSLKFDGWMHGLPEMFEELEKNDWLITTDIKNKIINIPEGTAVTDASTGTGYLIKPLEQGLFLEVVSDPENLSLPTDDEVDLSAVHQFADPTEGADGMGDPPAEADAPLRYSEGESVE